MTDILINNSINGINNDDIKNDDNIKDIKDNKEILKKIAINNITNDIVNSFDDSTYIEIINNIQNIIIQKIVNKLIDKNSTTPNFLGDNANKIQQNNISNSTIPTQNINKISKNTIFTDNKSKPILIEESQIDTKNSVKEEKEYKIQPCNYYINGDENYTDITKQEIEGESIGYTIYAPFEDNKKEKSTFEKLCQELVNKKETISNEECKYNEEIIKLQKELIKEKKIYKEGIEEKDKRQKELDEKFMNEVNKYKENIVDFKKQKEFDDLYLKETNKRNVGDKKKQELDELYEKKIKENYTINNEINTIFFDKYNKNYDLLPKHKCFYENKSGIPAGDCWESVDSYVLNEKTFNQPILCL